MTEQVQIQAPPDFQKRVIHFVTEYLNRGWRVRDAVLEALKATQDSYGADVEFRIGAEHVEKLVAYFESAVEAFRAQQEAGRRVVGGGLYAEVVSEDEYAEWIKKEG
jgi:hypothetical protein